MSETVVALVTGANTGIGEAVATRLATEFDYHVIVTGRKFDECKAVADKIVAQGKKASALHLDLEDDATIDAAVQQVEKEFGKLDVLVNNAAIKLDPLEPDKLREMYAKTFSINTIGTAIVTDKFTGLIRRAKAPRIVFVSSTTGSLTMSADPDSPWYNFELRAYDASKAAVNIVALNYARDLKDIGAMVNCVCPGLTQTKIVDFTPYGSPIADATIQIVELATLKEGGPTATFSDRNGPCPW
jgi:NAD(P)-dependent dehydrogenase (short-subunit alcohol dehydrogenase family)